MESKNETVLSLGRTRNSWLGRNSTLSCCKRGLSEAQSKRSTLRVASTKTVFRLRHCRAVGVGACSAYRLAHPETVTPAARAKVSLLYVADSVRRGASEKVYPRLSDPRDPSSASATPQPGDLSSGDVLKSSPAYTREMRSLEEPPSSSTPILVRGIADGRGTRTAQDTDSSLEHPLEATSIFRPSSPGGSPSLSSVSVEGSQVSRPASRSIIRLPSLFVSSTAIQNESLSAQRRKFTESSSEKGSPNTTSPARPTPLTKWRFRTVDSRQLLSQHSAFWYHEEADNGGSSSSRRYTVDVASSLAPPVFTPSTISEGEDEGKTSLPEASRDDEGDCILGMAPAPIRSDSKHLPKEGEDGNLLTSFKGMSRGEDSLSWRSLQTKMLTASSPPVETPETTTPFVTPAVDRPSPTKELLTPNSPTTVDTTPQPVMAQAERLGDVERWQQMLEKFNAVADDKDCKVPHKILEHLQEELLNKATEMELEPVLFTQTALEGENLRFQRAQNLVMSEADLRRAATMYQPANNVLSEPYPFFCRSKAGITIDQKGKTPLQILKAFTDQIGGGPTGGRNPVGNPIRSVEDFPICMFGTGKFDNSLRSNLIKQPDSGPSKWTTFSRACSPVRVMVCFKSTNPKRKLEKKELILAEAASSMLGKLASNWRAHRIRLFYMEAMRYQNFLPSVDRLSSKELEKEGWGSMTFEGTNNIKWKTIQGGRILTFISGVANADLGRALALIYDGDNHKQWIPFLTETDRMFAINPYNFTFSYGVGLPWPLNRRELGLLAMATDSLLVPKMNAVQIWGYNIPEAATTIWGIPRPANGNKKTVEMEMPVLSFSLAPLAPNSTYVMMVAMVDVKINFLPTSVVTHMAKIMATKMFSNVQNLVQNFDKTIYKDVLTENRALFNYFLTDVKEAETQFTKNYNEYLKPGRPGRNASKS